MARKRFKIRGLVLGLALLATLPLHAHPFFDGHAQGWHWYEALPLPELEKEEPAQPDRDKAKSPPASPLKTPAELVKAYREELEGRLHKAWVDPSHQNVRAYQEMQQDLMRRSKAFSTVWMQNVFQHPELDHTLEYPANQQARHLYLDLEKGRMHKAIQKLSGSYGLLFFFSGECPYCHKFAPIVREFSENFGWEVIAISTDGGKVAEFPEAQPDNGLSVAWNIKALPALYAINPQTQEAIPLAYGLTSLDDIANRVMALQEKEKP